MPCRPWRIASQGYEPEADDAPIESGSLGIGPVATTMGAKEIVHRLVEGATKQVSRRLPQGWDDH